MKWNDIKEQVPKIENRKYVIKNTSTGKFICDEKGRDRFFVDENEAKAYIKKNHLSSIFEIMYI